MVFSLILVVSDTIYRRFCTTVASPSKMPPPGVRNGPLIKSSRENALELFQKLAQSQGKFSVVHKAGTEIDPRILKLLEPVATTSGVLIERYELDEETGKSVLEIVLRKELPLVFINGDCIGGLQELTLLHTKGVIDNFAKKYDYDIIVIGGGSGGLAAAKEAALLGKKVAVLDYVKPSPLGTTWGLGGTCVNVGCIPKKLMHQAALLGHAIKDAKRFGWKIPDGDITLNWNKMRDAIQDHIGALNWGYRVQLREKTVNYINSYGVFTGTHEITATNKRGKTEKLTADRFLIAAGLRPRYLDIPGAKECCITSDDLFSLSYNPGKTLCIGASYVSLECAGFLHGIGSDVVVMVRSILLRGFDQDIAERIRKHMTDLGVKFESAIPLKFEQLKPPSDSNPGLVRVTAQRVLENGIKEEFSDEYNTVLLAIGRDAKTEDLGLEKMGVQVSVSGKIVGLREQSATAPHIYAIGDVLEGVPELTPVAIQAGKVLMRRIFTGNMELTEYDKVPTTVFTPLEYGCCGLSEEDSKKKYGDDQINVYHNVFIPLEFSVPDRMDTKHCYLKLICLKSDEDRVLGFHILSPNAGEITQGFGIAFKFDAKKKDFDRLIGIHPTVAENFTTLTKLKVEGEVLEASGC